MKEGIFPNVRITRNDRNFVRFQIDGQTHLARMGDDCSNVGVATIVSDGVTAIAYSGKVPKQFSRTRRLFHSRLKQKKKEVLLKTGRVASIARRLTNGVYWYYLIHSAPPRLLFKAEKDLRVTSITLQKLGNTEVVMWLQNRNLENTENEINKREDTLVFWQDGRIIKKIVQVNFDNFNDDPSKGLRSQKSSYLRTREPLFVGYGTIEEGFHDQSNPNSVRGTTIGTETFYSYLWTKTFASNPVMGGFVNGTADRQEYLHPSPFGLPFFEKNINGNSLDSSERSFVVTRDLQRVFYREIYRKEDEETITDKELGGGDIIFQDMKANMYQSNSILEQHTEIDIDDSGATVQREQYIDREWVEQPEIQVKVYLPDIPDLEIVTTQYHP